MDYGELAQRACGKKGEICVDFWTVLEGFGGCLGYLVIIGLNMSNVLRYWIGAADDVWYTSYYFLTALFLFVFMLPLTFIRQFGHFAWISVLSIASIGGVVLLVIFHGPGTGSDVLSEFAVLAESNCSASDLLIANDTAVLSFSDVTCEDTGTLQHAMFDAATCLQRCLEDEFCTVVQVPAGSLDGTTEPAPGGCVFCCAELEYCDFQSTNASSVGDGLVPANANSTDIYVIDDDQSCKSIQEIGIVKWASAGVFAALGAAAFALGCQTAAFHAYNTLEDANLQRWTWVCVVAVGVGALLCMITGFAGYFSFLNFVDGEILDSFPDSDIPAQVFRIFLVVHLILYYPVHFAIMRHSLAKLFGQDVLQMELKFYIPITVIPNLICLGVVMATQQFYVIVDLTGGIGGTLLYFIFPGILAIVLLTREGSDIVEKNADSSQRNNSGEAATSDENDQLSRKVVCGAKVMVFLGGLVMICTVTMTIICETSYGTELHDNC
eukprot:INCI5885.4.p1 GENE.INCI5885.4~~INCI5885.4.p1  ORF type:complete len:495 (-),score=96.30 INCI5885.4:2098-3582(-)